jgi:polar amino acid transport system substrate-binding protein
MRAVRYGHRPARVIATLAGIAACATAIGACGNADQSATSSAATTRAATSTTSTPADMVPANVRATGRLVVGTNVPFAPMEYFKADNKTFTGADIDLIEAIAAGLGLKTKISNQNWDGLVPAVASHRLDVTISGTGDFTDRQKQVDFVDYLNASAKVVMPKKYAGATDELVLCGLTVGAQSGSVQITATKAASKRCEAAGKPAIKLKTFQEDPQAALALKSGRVDAHPTDGPIAEQEAARVDGGKTMVALFPHFLRTTILYGIGVDKSKTGLTQAIQAELNVLIRNGTYAQILKRYHLENLALSEATINGGKTSSTAIS